MKLTEQQRTAMVKRLADYTEKASIASLSVGVFQSNMLGVAIGALAFICTVILTFEVNK